MQRPVAEMEKKKEQGNYNVDAAVIRDKTVCLSHLAQLFDHLFNADVPILRDLALHLREPLAQLLVLLIEHCPLIQLLAHLLLAQGKLTGRTVRMEEEGRLQGARERADGKRVTT